MRESHVHDAGRQLVGHLTLCVTRDAEGEHVDFYSETADPVGLTVSFIEFVCRVVPSHPNLLIHVARACQSREHVREVLAQLSDEARNTLGGLLQDANSTPESEDAQD